MLTSFLKKVLFKRRRWCSSWGETQGPHPPKLLRTCEFRHTVELSKNTLLLETVCTHVPTAYMVRKNAQKKLWTNTCMQLPSQVSYALVGSMLKFLLHNSESSLINHVAFGPSEA